MRSTRYVMPAFAPALFLMLGCAGSAIAQDAQDPPARIGRLSFLTGDVSFRPAGVDDWTDATLNYPLTTGDDLWADAGSRAEIALGSAAVRLAPSTAFGFLALDDQITQIRLTQGSLQVRIRDLANDEAFEIDTPNGAVSLLEPGTYRVDVDADGDATTLTVRDGEAELTASGSSFSVDAGEAATVRGTDSPEYDVHEPGPADEWERWSAARDRRRDLSLSARYVSPDLPGYEDLDDSGDWSRTSEYGPVWTPRRVAAGWAPYRNGHWAWVDPWGWTWIDDAPWGFAPYHYGRWVYVGRGWAWVPGRIVARPVYAPALVAFVGGSNFSISVGVGGGVGWFPLGPNEAYVPTYRVSNRYVQNINITTINVTNITLADMTTFKYRNRGSPGGVTVVTRETFVGSRPVGRSLIVVPRDRLNRAPVVGTAAPFAPTRQSVIRQGGRPARRPPAADMTRRVVVRTAPPPARVPFSVRERAMQERPGRPLDDATLGTLRARTPATDDRRVRSATGGSGPALRPSRQGLPEARPATPETGGRRRGQVDRARPPERTQPVDRSAPPTRDDRGRRQEGARPQPEPRPPVETRRPDDRPSPPMPTPPRLPAENPQPQQPPRQDRGRRPDTGRPQAEPRPPVTQPTPEPPKAPEPPAQPPRQDRGRRPDTGRPQPEPRPPAAEPTPEPPKAPEPPAQPRQDRGRRPDRGQPQAEPRPPAAEPTPEPPKVAEPPARPSREDRGRRPDVRRPEQEPPAAAPPTPTPPPPPQAAPAEPATPAEPAAPPRRERPSRPSRGDQDSSGNNPRQGRNPR